MITTLVLSAGNLHGIMHVGAFKALYEHGMVQDIKTVIACSSGAITGLMMCLHYTPEEMEDTMHASS